MCVSWVIRYFPIDFLYLLESAHGMKHPLGIKMAPPNSTIFFFLFFFEDERTDPQKSSVSRLKMKFHVAVITRNAIGEDKSAQRGIRTEMRFQDENVACDFRNCGMSARARYRRKEKHGETTVT